MFTRNFVAGTRILVACSPAAPSGRSLEILKTNGAVLSTVVGTSNALASFSANNIDLIIIELDLPDFNGRQIIHAVQTSSTKPLIVIGPAREETEVAYLAAGADDYLPDHAGPAVVLARVLAILRRSGTRFLTNEASLVYDDGYLHIDLRSRRLVAGSRNINLAPKEYDLLRYLLLHLGKPRTYEQILLNVWDRSCLTRSHYVHTYIGHLRRKLEKDPANPEYLQTVYGIGYQFVAAGAEAKV